MVAAMKPGWQKAIIFSNGKRLEESCLSLILVIGTITRKLVILLCRIMNGQEIMNCRNFRINTGYHISVERIEAMKGVRCQLELLQHPVIQPLHMNGKGSIILF